MTIINEGDETRSPESRSGDREREAGRWSAVVYSGGACGISGILQLWRDSGSGGVGYSSGSARGGSGGAGNGSGGAGGGGRGMCGGEMGVF